MFDLFRSRNKDEVVSRLPVEWPHHVVILTHESFAKFIGMYPLSVVDFWAPWCGPCKTMFPRFRRLSRLYEGTVAFGRVNVKGEEKIAKQYNILGIPFFGFFRYGKKIGEVTGVKSVGDMKKFIDTYIARFER